MSAFPEQVFQANEPSAISATNSEWRADPRCGVSFSSKRQADRRDSSWNGRTKPMLIARKPERQPMTVTSREQRARGFAMSRKAAPEIGVAQN